MSELVEGITKIITKENNKEFHRSGDGISAESLAQKIAESLTLDEEKIFDLILKSEAKGEYKQVCIVLLRDILAIAQENVIKVKD